jgi:uncharacterized membrane protein YesL
MRSRASSSGRQWEAVLRALEFVAYPALAGAAFCVLCLGVVTWLPAMAAMASVLRRWWDDGESRCFTGVFAEFPHYWRRLWRHGLVSTAAIAVLAANAVFLADQPSLPAFALLAVQVGIAVALVPYHLALAASAALTPDGDTAQWRSRALLLAFGSAGRGVGLLGAAVTAPVISLVIPFGPLLLGPSLPVLYAVILADQEFRSRS